jgi:Na+-transporting methylmalonyl-CoA/oxaloacetate decarboxylase gamma subunit
MIKGGILIVLAGMAFSLIFLAILMSNWSKIRQTKIAKDESEKYERLAAEAVEVQR